MHIKIAPNIIMHNIITAQLLPNCMYTDSFYGHQLLEVKLMRKDPWRALRKLEVHAREFALAAARCGYRVNIAVVDADTR